MTDREKLIELLNEASEILLETAGGLNDNHGNGIRADHLIAHGVTVQKEGNLYWKPVKPGEWNLTCSACDSHLGCRENSKFCPKCGAKFVNVLPKVPVPQPPKE